MSGRTRVLLIVQMLVSVGMLVWIFQRVGIGEKWEQLRGEMDVGWFAVALAVAGGGIWLESVRWGIIMRMQRITLPWKTVYQISLSSTFFNLIVPGGMDAARIAGLIRRAGENKTGAALSVAMDRLCGLTGIFTMTCIFTFPRIGMFAGTGVAQWLLILLMVFFASITGFVLLVNWLGRMKPKYLLKVPERLRRRLRRFWISVELFRRAGIRFFWAILVSIGVYACYFLVFGISAVALSVGVSIWDVLMVMPLIDMVAGLPISFAGLGVREMTFEGVMSGMFEIPAGTAVFISLGGFLCTTFWNLLGGCVFLCSCVKNWSTSCRKN